MTQETSISLGSMVDVSITGGFHIVCIPINMATNQHGCCPFKGGADAQMTQED